MAEKKRRGRPQSKFVEPIHDTFENVLKAVVQPMSEERRREISRKLRQGEE